MDAETILETLRRAGAKVYAEGATVCIEPADALDNELRDAIRAAKPAILKLLLPDQIRWRVEAMLHQVPPAGPIRGLLVARDGAWFDESDRCVSCGDRVKLDLDDRRICGVAIRCEACAEAAWIAIPLGRSR